MKILRGLYAITPDGEDTKALLARTELALQGGVALVQYRNKQADAAGRLQQASALLPLCRRYGRPLIINDDVQLALTIGADGVHLGSDDGDLAAARRLLGPGRLLGASCYNRLELAHAAAAAGADYLAFGAAFASRTKPHAVRAPLDLYRQARALALPVVAIGGITTDNAATLVGAGVDAIAVIAALFDAPDIRAQASAFAAVFDAVPPIPA